MTKIHFKNNQTEFAELKNIKTKLKLKQSTEKFKGDKTTEERTNWEVRKSTQNTSWRGKIMAEFNICLMGIPKRKEIEKNTVQPIFPQLLAKNFPGQIHRFTNPKQTT